MEALTRTHPKSTVPVDDDTQLCNAMLCENQAILSKSKEAFESAYRAFLPLAEKGNTYAQLRVGLMYKEGRGFYKTIKTPLIGWKKLLTNTQTT